MKENQLSDGRRGFLQKMLAVAGTCAAVPVLTPRQPKGPFYPTGREPLAGFTKDNDLTFIETGTAPARGQIMELGGQVLDSACAPISGALVEIWQACESGRYNHENDPNPAPLDPNFQYYGRSTTDAQGFYRFRTVVPGAYPAGTAPDGSPWIRPPHIHFRVLKVGYSELISQMYFAGEALNDKDLILQDVPEAERAELVVALAPHPSEVGAKIATWDITLLKPARSR